MALLDTIDSVREDFVWKDGERLVSFGRSALASLPAFLRAAEMEQYALLSTDRAIEQFSAISIGGGDVVAAASSCSIVGPGGVAELAAGLSESVGGLPIVAIGGGRVLDTAKAIASTTGVDVAAIPTTLSGAPMSGSHRLPAGFSGRAQTIRPRVVIANPDLMASQPKTLRVGSAMNALSHAVEAIFVETSSAVPRLAAVRAINLIGRALGADRDDPETRLRLSLGAIEAGYALGAVGFALHHVICQTIVRIGGVAHAPTYAVLLPYTLEFYKLRDELAWSLIRDEIGAPDPSVALARICAESGAPTTLTGLGMPLERIDQIVAAASERPELRLTPGGATAHDVRALIESAL